ncbi:hypothetical protein [Streptomyces gilvus]|uniref:hypothetical protein n=1 Tax=Streptomyces gilvus TaxID=2920937 RepID=UPI001F0E6556|nr:hypothetical protein [Streptomyces sp. CME 23]MCH5677853.1 hypothetical protein [Streptomyces sp. CME 23]
MTEPLTRPTVTPAVLAQRKPTPPAPASRLAAYDRHAWEEALMAPPLQHHAARLLGWGLAHMAGERGYLPPGTTDTGELARPLRLTGKQVRLSLRQLEQAGLVSRPDIRTWEPKNLLRPISLTLPTAEQLRRQEPPSTSEDR